MQEWDVIIVGETPSLGHAIEDLLGSDEINCRYVDGISGVDGGGPGTMIDLSRRLIIAASNTRISPTARAWIRGDLPARELIVVGSRDPEITAASGIHLLRLPLPRNLFLGYVRLLLGLPLERDLAEHSGAPVLASS